MKKIIMIAMMVLSSTSLFAQKNSFKDPTFTLETGIGTEWEIGGHLNYAFNQYLSWDMLKVKYALDYGDVTCHELTVQTGLRGFSPSFGPSLKAFAALDLGYGGMTAKDADWWNAFALDFTIGIQLKNGLYFGYGLGTMHNDGTHKDHLFRLGYNF